jgi:hypothetical protein
MMKLTPEEREIERLDKQTDRLREEIDRLNRLMPHIGGTCKWNDGKSLQDLSVAHKCPHGCQNDVECFNDKWELKE